MPAVKETSDIRIIIEEAKNHPDHSHQEIELDYVLSGSLMLSIAGQRYQMEQGDILLINSGKLHAWREAAGCLLCRLMINYSSVCRVVGKYHISFWCNSVSNGFHDTDGLREVLNQLIKEFHVSGDTESFAMTSLKYRVLDILTNEYLLPGNESWSDVEDDRIREILDQVNVSYSGQISLSEIAGRMYMSESHLSRMFKNAVGVSFKEYVNRARLEYAVESILYSSKSIAEISEDCGFSNPSAFNKLFKKTYGCAPTEYRKTLTERVVLPEGEDVLREEAEDRLADWILQQEEQTAGQPEETDRVTIRPAEQRAFEHNTVPCINCGAAYDLILAKVQEQILMIHGELGIQYIRIFGLFDRDLHLRSDTDPARYHFALVDSILDFLVDHDMIPVIDLLTWRKKIYAEGEKLLFSDSKGDWLPFHSLSDWCGLLNGIFRHCVDRYGAESVSQWIIELPDQSDYHDVCVSTGAEEIPYDVLWDAAYDTIKGVCPDIEIGGVSTLLQSDRQGRIPDFIIMKLFPYSSYSEDVYSSRITNLDYVEKAVKKERRILRNLGFPEIRLMISAWSTSLSERNYYNDTCAKAAHVLYHLLTLEGENCMMCYHHGLDHMSLFVDTEAPLVGGNGLITADGIKKPIFYAFYFMNRLQGQILEKGRNHVVVKHREGDYYILTFHPKNFGHTYYLHRESLTKLDDLEKMYVDELKRKVVFTFEDIPAGSYQIKGWALAEREGCALYEWMEMGCPAPLRPSEIEYLRGVSRPRVRTSTVETKQGTLNVDIVLDPHQIALIHIVRS